MKIHLQDAPASAVRRKLLLGLPGGLALASPLAMVACGGGDEPAASVAQARGQMVLPAGVVASDVTIVSNLDEVHPAADGRFAVALHDDSLALLNAVHSNGRIVQLAMVRSTAAAQGLDARSSAAALMFLAAGGWALGSADRQRLLDRIGAEAQVATLAGVIEARQAIDPFALDGPDPQIEAALRTALASARASVAMRRAFARSGGRERALADASVTPLLRIEPGNDVSGITVNQDGDEPGFTILNTKRRGGVAHAYKVAYVPPQGARVDLGLAETLYERIEVASTQSLSVFSALSDVLSGTAPWSPVTTPRHGLPMQAGAEQTIYEVVYITPVYDRAEPAFFGEVRYSLLREGWREELRQMYESTQLELVFGAVLEALGFGGIARSSLTFNEAVAAIRAAATTDIIELLAQAGVGTGLLPGFRAWLVSVSSGNAIVSGAYRVGVARLVRTAQPQFAANLAAGNLSVARKLAFSGSIRVMLAVSVVAGVLDTAALYRDLHDGENGNLFTATLVAPKVLVSPSSGRVGKGSEQTLTARVTGAQGLTLTYRWALTGSSLANLSDRAGKIGATIDTDSDTVVLATTPSTVGTLTIVVEAFQVKPGGNVSLGTATSVLEMDDTTVAITPSSARIERVGGSQAFTLSITPAPADPLSYEWSCPSQWGTLSSGGATTSAAQPTITSTVATATYAGRAGLDGGESETLRCTAFTTHPDPNTGATVRVDVGSATADVAIKQKFNLELLALPSVLPADNTVPVVARITDPVPSGATIEWTWLHSGVGTIQTNAGDANKPNSSVQFDAGSTEGLALFTVSARVTVPGQPAVPVLPVTGSTQVKKGLTQVVFEAHGGVFGCTDPLACGVSEYTAFIVPRFSKAVLYRAVLSGFAFAGCNRAVTWNSVVGDGGGCSFPVTYFPHSSAGQTNAWAVWIGFGGPISGKCVVTVTLAP